MAEKGFIRIFYVIVLSLVLMLQLPPSTASSTKGHQNRCCLSSTGNIASTGLDCKRGIDLAVDIINGKYDLDLPGKK